MDQFSEEDKKIIAKSDRMGDNEEKNTKCLIEYQTKSLKMNSNKESSKFLIIPKIEGIF